MAIDALNHDVDEPDRLSDKRPARPPDEASPTVQASEMPAREAQLQETRPKEGRDDLGKAVVELASETPTSTARSQPKTGSSSAKTDRSHS
jgi:hypothetical protein